MKLKFKPTTAEEKFALKVYNSLVENFPQTFFVGGFVRDLLLRKKTKDFDLATSALPEQVEKVLLKNKLAIDSSQKKLGVIKLYLKNTEVAVVTLRKETYTGSRYPRVLFTRNLKLDAQRRDFAVNALYFKPKTGELKDFFDGVGDIQSKTISFIGAPKKRIMEDPLRIIRALRLALALRFHIEKRTYQTIKENFSEIKKLTKAGIEKEILKTKNKKLEKNLKEVINNPEKLDKFFISF